VTLSSELDRRASRPRSEASRCRRSCGRRAPNDLVSIIDAPSEEAMMGAMANVVAAGNVSSTTMRAFDDKEMEGILKKV
jgi:GYD domain-containing protein